MSRERFRSKQVVESEVIPHKERIERTPITGWNEAQCRYIEAIRTSPLTFGIGPAGTGKTYIVTALAAEMIAEKTIDRIVISRPAVEAGESLGFLPGKLSEKFDPYFAPVREVLNRRLGASHVENLIKNGRITVMPLALMRGHTFNDSLMILDEAQNTSPGQMKMFLSRVGKHSSVVVNGDPTQRDLPGECGLTDAMCKLLVSPMVKKVGFTEADIVRSGLARQIIMAYRT